MDPRGSTGYRAAASPLLDDGEPGCSRLEGKRRGAGLTACHGDLPIHAILVSAPTAEYSIGTGGSGQRYRRPLGEYCRAVGATSDTTRGAGHRASAVTNLGDLHLKGGDQDKLEDHEERERYSEQ